MSVMPVVDEEKHLLGVITVDDVVDVVDEEAPEDVFMLSGTAIHDEKTLISGSLIKPILFQFLATYYYFRRYNRIIYY